MGGEKFGVRLAGPISFIDDSRVPPMGDLHLSIVHMFYRMYLPLGAHSFEGLQRRVPVPLL